MKLEEVWAVNKLVKDIQLWEERESFMLTVINSECPIVEELHKFNQEAHDFAKIICDLPEDLKLKIINMVMESVVDKKETLETEFEDL